MKLNDVLEIVRARLDVASDAWIVGEDRLDAHEATDLALPRYVWVPTRDRFGPPERAGGNPRTFLTRLAGVELHLWATSYSDCETRLNAALLALFNEAATSVDFEDANWAGPSLVGRGYRVAVNLRVKIPVLRVEQPVVRVLHVASDPSGAAAGDGTLQCGEI